MTITLDDAARVTCATVHERPFVAQNGDARSSFVFKWPKDGPVEYMRDVRFACAQEDSIEEALQHALYLMQDRYHGGAEKFNDYLRRGGEPWPNVDAMVKLGVIPVNPRG